MQIIIHGVDVSANYTPDELGTFSIVQSATGNEPGTGDAFVIDPTGLLVPFSGQSFQIISGGETIFDGFVGASVRSRGGIVHGARVVQNITVADENALLNGHRSVNAKRPKEKADARMKWAIGHYLEYLELDTSMVLMDSSKKVPAKTYLTEDVFGELQSDCGDPTGKILFIENRRIHWHLPEDGDVAGAEIVGLGDEDRAANQFELDSAMPPTKSKDPADLSSSVIAINSKHQKYRVDDATAVSRYDTGGVRHYRLIDSPDSDLDELKDLADGLLSQNNRERVTYEGTIRSVTPAQVMLMPPGSLITCTDAVWSLTGSQQRIAQRTLKYVHPDKWDVSLQLNYPVRSHAGSGGSSGPGGAPNPTPDPPGPYVPASTACAFPDDPHGDGSLHAFGAAVAAYIKVVDLGFILHAGTDITVSFNASRSQNDPGVIKYLTTFLLAAGGDPALLGTLGTGSGGDVIGDGDPILQRLRAAEGTDSTSGNSIAGRAHITYTLGRDTCALALAVVPEDVDTSWFTDGTSYITLESYTDPFPEVVSNPPPETGQTVTETPATPGGTLIGHTEFPYVPGSLRIKMSGIDLTPGQDFVETDPHLGLYAFTNEPRADAEIIVKYDAQGAQGTTDGGDQHGGTLPGGAAGGPVISPVTPPSLTTGIAAGFIPGVVLVQNETAAGYARMVADAASTMAMGQHYAQFGPACDGSNAASRLHQGDGMDLEIAYGGMAPPSLDINGVGCAGNQSRLKNPAAVLTFAGLMNTWLGGNAAIQIITFWNELKGYYDGSQLGSWDPGAYCDDFIPWATAVKAAHPGIKIAGPYTTGQNGQNEVGGLDERIRFIHQTFIDRVVTPHPTLVDFIAWDHWDATKHRSYTGFYSSRGITIPHIVTEWYPPNSPGSIARLLLDMATNPLMKACMLWGSGTDSYRYAPLWDPSGTPTANWTAMVAVAAFTSVGSVQNTGPNTWVNSAAQTCTVSGDTVTVV